MCRPFASFAVCFAIAAFLTWGGLQAQPKLASGRFAEVTEDGLHRLDPDLLDTPAWVVPNFDLSPYTKILLMPTGISFRTAEDRPYRFWGLETRNNFPVDDRMKVRMRAAFGEAFRDEMAKADRFDVSDNVGRDVLLVQGFLVDVVSHIPPRGLRTDMRTDSTWEALIVLELRDSMSHRILARSVEHEQARPRGGVEPAALWPHTEGLIRRWSRLLRERLDDLATL